VDHLEAGGQRRVLGEFGLNGLLLSHEEDAQSALARGFDCPGNSGARRVITPHRI
jgi:hypothetical protein